MWLCSCDCGGSSVVAAFRIKQNRTRSCGCLARERSSKRMKTHGMSKHRLFPIWDGMMGRCYRKHNQAYYRYGGRGISVCERWHDVSKFIADNEDSYQDGLSLDRIDNDGAYSPENTRWVNNVEQSRNRRTNVFLTYQGKTQTLFEWADEVGIRPRTLWRRIRQSGWSVERALTTPVKR